MQCFDGKYSEAVFISTFTMNIEKAKRALATLEREKQAQKDSLQLAAEVQQQLDNKINRINTLRP